MPIKNIKDRKEYQKKYNKQYWVNNRVRINKKRGIKKPLSNYQNWETVKPVKSYKLHSDMITIHLIGKIKEYPKFDYREAMRVLYYNYQNSKGWKEVVKAVRARDNNRCVDCGKSEGRLIVHHTSYDNWGFGDFREIEDCILVCVICHNKRHWDNSIKVPFWAGRNMMSKELQEEINQVEREVEI